MTYHQLQTDHVLRLKPLRVRGKSYDRFQVHGDARKVHAAIVQVLKDVGAAKGRTLHQVAPKQLTGLVKAKLGIQPRSFIGGLFAPLAEMLIGALISALLPIVIEWLEEQLSQLRGGPGVVDELLGQYAREAAG
jgi:hypothetical protein